MTNPGPGYTKHPDHQVTLADHPGRHRILFNGETVADSSRTLLMTESGYARVHYFPLTDVRMELLLPSDHQTHCPFKGQASYWHVTVGEKTAENAVWAYPDSYDEVVRIRDRVAFDMDQMDEILFGG